MRLNSDREATESGIAVHRQNKGPTPSGIEPSASDFAMLPLPVHKVSLATCAASHHVFLKTSSTYRIHETRQTRRHPSCCRFPTDLPHVCRFPMDRRENRSAC